MSLVLGLDVTARAVRGAFLRTTLRGSTMERYAEAPLSQSTDEDGHAHALRSAVADLLEETTRPPDQVIASLAGDRASLRMIDLPAGVAKKVGDVLPGELEAVLPFNISEAVLDHQIVARDGVSIQVLAVASPRENVANRLRELQEAGVDPRQLAVGAACFEGLGPLLPETLQDRTILVIDIGPDTTDFCVLQDGNAVFARTLSGGLDQVETGQRGLLSASLQRTLASYRATHDQEPALILLCGETAPLEGARKWLTEQLGLECGVVPLPEATGADPETRPTFARAAALAARAIDRKKRLDLRQGEFASRVAAGELRRQLRLVGICFAAVVLAFGVSLLARYRVASAEHERLSETLATVSADLLGDETTSAMRARELLTGGPAKTDPLPRFDAYDVLEAISESIPTEIQHDTRRLVIEIDDEGDQGRFEIQGTVNSIAERDQIVEAFEDHRCFQEIDKGPTSTTADARKNYKLVVSIECTEARPRDQEDG